MRHTTLAAVAVTVLVLAGCSSTTSSTPKAVPSSSPAVSKEDQFLAAIHGASIASWAINGPTDAEILAYPDKWCAALDDGHSVSYILSGAGMYPAGMSWGTKKADAEHVLVMAVTAYCPSHRAALVQELQASGDW